MSKATYPLKLPLSIKRAAQRFAKEDGVSLNQWIAVAVARIGDSSPLTQERIGTPQDSVPLNTLHGAILDFDTWKTSD